MLSRTLPLTLFISCICGIVYAKQTEFIREYSYHANDIDNNISSRRVTAEKVKRELLNDLSTHISSITKTNLSSGIYSAQDIITLTSGITNFEIINEDWNGKKYNLKAKLTTDPNELTQSLALLKRMDNAERRAKKAEEIATNQQKVETEKPVARQASNNPFSITILQSHESLYKELNSNFEQYQSDALIIKAPEETEFGSIVPVMLSINANEKGKLYLYLSSNETKLVSITEYLQPTSEYYFRARLKIADTGDILAAFITDSGKIYTQKKLVEVADGAGAKPKYSNKSASSETKMQGKRTGNSLTLQTLLKSNSSLNDYIESVEFYFDNTLSAVSYLSPYISKNPFIAIKFDGNFKNVFAVSKTNKGTVSSASIDLQ